MALTMKAFARHLAPVYIVLDSLQEVHDCIEDYEQFDILSDASKCGCHILVTTDMRIRKTAGGEFIKQLADASEGLVLGSIRDQSVFSFTGIREDNHSLDLGYYHKCGSNWKIKLIEN